MVSEKKIEEEKVQKKAENTGKKKLVCDSRPDYDAPKNVRPPKERKIVKGIFKYIECPGGIFSFPFRIYKEPIKTYHLLDGGTYELPIEVVDHLNNNCCYKFTKWVASTGEETLGVPVNAPGQLKYKKEIGQVIQRVMFQPMNIL